MTKLTQFIIKIFIVLFLVLFVNTKDFIYTILLALTFNMYLLAYIFNILMDISIILKDLTKEDN